MSLEQTIRDTLVSESMDLDARLQQLVRAGLMPQNTLPLLRKAIAKVQMGLSLQGPERDVMATFINSMMYIVLGDDTIFNKARAGAKSYAVEEKEKQEYDYEGDMAMSQLKSIIANSQKMHDMLSDDTNLPEWVQSKITLAEDYITTAANYMQGEMSEAVGDFTVKTISPADAWKKHTEPKKSKSKVPVDPKTGKTLYQKVTSEETEKLDEEQIDEISKKTLASYSDKAVRQTNGNQPHGKDALRKRTNREKGVKAAYNKFFGYKTKVPATEETQIDELSKATLGRYVKKSAERMSTQGVVAGLKIAKDEKSQNNFDTISKRSRGISTAVKKLTKESRKTEALADISAIKQMNESYKTTFDAALETYGIKSPSELDEEKRREFFNFVDQNYKKGDN